MQRRRPPRQEDQLISQPAGFHLLKLFQFFDFFFFFLNWNSLRQSVPPSSDSVWLLKSCHLAWPGASVIVECGAGQLHYSALRLTVQVLATRRPGEALTKVRVNRIDIQKDTQC